jgi:signal transduction histidine kinase
MATAQDARTRVSRKLMLIGLFFLVPDSLMLYLAITGLDANIDFARLEQQGIRYQRPLERLLDGVGDHRLLAHAAGASGPSHDGLVAVQAQIDQAFADLLAIDAELGSALQFTEAGLAKRHREQCRAALVAEDWRTLKADLGTLDADASEARHLHLIAALRTMITHVGDQSNLILDPDLDSYYLMDATLLALPQNQDRLAGTTAFGRRLIAQGTASEEERMRLHVDIALLAEADRDRVVASIHSAVQEDANFNGVSPTLQSRIPPLMAGYGEAIDAFIARCRRLAEAGGGTVQADDFLAAGARARAASFALWDGAADELDGLLQRRIDHYRSVRLFSLSAAALTLVSAIALITYITRSITKPLTRQAMDLATANAALKTEMEERSRIEMQLRHAQKMESIGQLAAGIAHEINTPVQYVGDNAIFLKDSFVSVLQLVSHYDRLLEQARQSGTRGEWAAEVEVVRKDSDIGFLHSEIPKAIQQAQEGIVQIAEIVRAMKAFSHPGSAAKQPADLNQGIANTIVVARNQWKAVADLTTDFQVDLPPVVCHPGEIWQALLNVIVNAAQAVGAVVKDGERGQITASTRRDGDWVEIRITDTGGGIPEDIRGRVFDPFFTTKAVGSGTGQGLAIAQAIVVQKHGGTIAFENGPGRGTAFIIRLPLVEAQAEAMPLPL